MREREAAAAGEVWTKKGGEAKDEEEEEEKVEKRTFKDRIEGTGGELQRPALQALCLALPSPVLSDTGTAAVQ